MSEKKITKAIEVESCHVAEREADKYMTMTLLTKSGTYEFTFSPERWQRLGETAKWFQALTNDASSAQPSAEETNK